MPCVSTGDPLDMVFTLNTHAASPSLDKAAFLTLLHTVEKKELVHLHVPHWGSFTAPSNPSKTCSGLVNKVKSVRDGVAAHLLLCWVREMVVS